MFPDRCDTCRPGVKSFRPAVAGSDQCLSFRDREARNQALAALCSRTGAEIVQRVGNVGVFYRRHTPVPKLIIPD